MARIGRLAGAILAETRGRFYLIGNTKVPCDFAAAGFEPPVAESGPPHRFVRLRPLRSVDPAPPRLLVEVEGEALAHLLADRLLIERTGSVSERLWRLVTGQSDEDDHPPRPEVAARWLGEVPPAVWRIVRDTVLRCS